MTSCLIDPFDDILLLLFLKAVPSIRFNKPQKNSFVLFGIICTII